MTKPRLLLIPILIFTILACSCSNNADVRDEVSMATEPPAIDAVGGTSEDTEAVGTDESQSTQTEAVTEATEAVLTTSPTTEATTTAATTAATKPTTQPTTKATTKPTTKSAAKSTTVAATTTNPTTADTAASEDEEIVVLDDEDEEVLEPVVCGMPTYVDEQYTDYIIYQGVIYISHAGQPYGKDGFYITEYIPGDKLMEITEVSSNRVLAELSDGTASLLPVGTEIYKCQNRGDFILALVDEEYIPYFGLIEG